MKLIIVIIFCCFFLKFDCLAFEKNSNSIRFLENSFVKVGFIPELTGRIVYWELKKHSSNIISDVIFAKVPLLPDMTVVCSNSNGSRIMNWEQGAFRANITFDIRKFSHHLSMKGKVGDFEYTREFFLPENSLILYEKAIIKNCSKENQIVSLWHQNCGIYSVQSPAVFKNLIWNVPSATVRPFEKTLKKSPARIGVNSPGIVEYSLAKEKLGLNISVNPCSNFMALTNKQTKISAIFVIDNADINKDGFFNGWFGKVASTHLASIEIVSNEEKLLPNQSKEWNISHILTEGLNSVNGVGKKILFEASYNNKIPSCKIQALSWIKDCKLVLSNGDKVLKSVSIKNLQAGKVHSFYADNINFKTKEKVFCKLYSKAGKIVDEFQVLLHKHKSFL